MSKPLSEKYLRIARGLGAHDADYIRYRLDNEHELALRANAAHNATYDTLRAMTSQTMCARIECASVQYRNDVLIGYGYTFNTQSFQWQAPTKEQPDGQI